MKKCYITILLFLIAFSLISCVDETSITTTVPSSTTEPTTTVEEVVDVIVASSSLHDNYVFKERLKIISTQEEALEVSEFFINNLYKDDILSTYVSEEFFESYTLLTGYVNVSHLDGEITIDSVNKFSDTITIQLESEFDDEWKDISDRVELSYVYFIIQVDKNYIDPLTELDVEFIGDDLRDQLSTYEFNDQPTYVSDIEIENVYRFSELDYFGPIMHIESSDSYDEFTNIINDSDRWSDIYNLDDLPHDEEYFETHSYIFLSYTFTWEYIVSVMGLNLHDDELQVVISGNRNIDGVPIQRSKANVVFVIDVLKSDIENVVSFSCKNYNLYNGDNNATINNNNINYNYEITDFELAGTISNSSKAFITTINSVDEINESIQSWESNDHIESPNLDDYTFDDDFFDNNIFLVVPITWNFGIHDLTASEIWDYGAYYEILITTSSSEFGDHTANIVNEIFLIIISKSVLNENPIFVTSVVFLGDQ